MQATQIDEDLILGTASGGHIMGESIPEALIGLTPEQLRYNGTTIIDASTITNWYIDAAGQKRLNIAPNRQLLVCDWDDELINDAGSWRVKTSADDLKKYLKNKRKVVENAGVIVSGVRIPTDIGTRNTIALIVAKLGSGQLTAPVNFVLDGSAIAATQLMFEDWDAAITAHVQAAFDIQASLLADIDSALISTTTEIDNIAWPG